MLKKILLVILMSCFLFPCELNALRGVNSKMALAGIGLIVLTYQLIKKEKTFLNKDYLIASIIGAVISLASFTAMTVNNTNDTSFLTYIVSFWVWTSAANVVVLAIRKVYGNATIEHVGKYIVAVCLGQCIIAYLISLIPALKAFVDTIFYESVAFSNSTIHRMYGIGAALDPAGLRFAAALTIATYLAVNQKTPSRKMSYFYAIAFLIITVIGNIISRTTTLGVLLSIIYVGCHIVLARQRNSIFARALSILLVITIPLGVYLYKENEGFRNNIEFGFEGFFSLVETGEWHTRSTHTLTTSMMKFPDNTKTWLVGDGYGADTTKDPNYLGKDYYGYYMMTDVGYCRFLFYFGIFGLLSMLAFKFSLCNSLMNRFEDHKILFVLLLFVTLIGWIKVTSDILMVFAIFMCLSEDDTEPQNDILLTE